MSYTFLAIYVILFIITYILIRKVDIGFRKKIFKPFCIKSNYRQENIWICFFFKKTNCLFQIKQTSELTIIIYTIWFQSLDSSHFKRWVLSSQIFHWGYYSYDIYTALANRRVVIFIIGGVFIEFSARKYIGCIQY